MQQTNGAPAGSRHGLGLRALIATAVGVVVVQSTMISMLNGAGLGALNYLAAIGLAALLALSYVLSFAELALMLPRAGSVSAYTQVALGPGLAQARGGRQLQTARRVVPLRHVRVLNVEG